MNKINNLIQCDKCNGRGIVKCKPIECTNCNGSKYGCYKYDCKIGYIQLFYKECNKCIGKGILN